MFDNMTPEEIIADRNKDDIREDVRKLMLLLGHETVVNDMPKVLWNCGPKEFSNPKTIASYRGGDVNEIRLTRKCAGEMKQSLAHELCHSLQPRIDSAPTYRKADGSTDIDLYRIDPSEIEAREIEALIDYAHDSRIPVIVEVCRKAGLSDYDDLAVAVRFLTCGYFSWTPRVKMVKYFDQIVRDQLQKAWVKINRMKK